MNKEERKAIEDMNRFANGIDMSCVTARQMQIILNLVEKLQKENEKELEMLKDFKEIAESKVTELNPIRISKNESVIK